MFKSLPVRMMKAKLVCVTGSRILLVAVTSEVLSVTNRMDPKLSMHPPCGSLALRMTPPGKLALSKIGAPMVVGDCGLLVLAAIKSETGVLALHWMVPKAHLPFWLDFSTSQYQNLTLLDLP